MQAVHAFAEQHGVPMVHFRRGQRKDDVAAWYRARFAAEEGVVFVGLAQEKAVSFKAAKRTGGDGHLWFEFSRQPVAVTQVYFYLQDRGPAFVKISSYLPYPVRVCLNGHEWAKQQLRREGIAFEAGQRLPLVQRPRTAPGALRRARAGQGAGVLPPLGRALALAAGCGGPRGRHLYLAE